MLALSASKKVEIEGHPHDPVDLGVRMTGGRAGQRNNCESSSLGLVISSSK